MDNCRTSGYFTCICGSIECKRSLKKKSTSNKERFNCYSFTLWWSAWNVNYQTNTDKNVMELFSSESFIKSQLLWWGGLVKLLWLISYSQGRCFKHPWFRKWLISKLVMVVVAFLLFSEPTQMEKFCRLRCPQCSF